MKKVILGSVMILAGIIPVTWLLVSAMEKEWMIDGEYSAFATLSYYGVMPAFYIFIGIAVIGFILALVGVFEKKND